MSVTLAHSASDRSTARDDAHVTGLAVAARDGDQDALEGFVRATRADVKRFVAHLSSDRHAIEDLTQETYLRAITGLPRFAAQSTARTWLLSIARRVVIDRYRMASVRPRIVDGSDWESAAERATPRALPGFEEGVALLELVGQLEPLRQRAFLLTQVHGLAYAEAARTIGCPIGTVRSRVARAREDIQMLLQAAETDTRPMPLAG